MKSLQVSRTKFLFALCIIFGLAGHTQQATGCENAQEVMLKLVEQEEKECSAVLRKIVAVLYEFVHDLDNGKYITQYLKELNKLNKELGETAKFHYDNPHRTLPAATYKQTYKLHKDYHKLIAIIEANKFSPAAISTKLMQNPELKVLIPEEAGWTLVNIFPALNARCKK